MNSFPTNDANKESKGAMIGTIIIIILLIIGGFYVLANRRAEAPIPLPEEETGAVDTTNTTIVSNDETAVMQAELDAEIKAMEAEMQAMEAEIGRF